ncbi:TIGR04219 family outer membrane beta-barrel protein [Persephonella sp.]
MKKSLSILAICSLFGVSSAVPLFEGEVSAGYIKQKPSGWIQYKGDEVDVKDDLKLGDEDSYFLKAKFEHPVPVIPNIAVQYVKKEFTGNGRISKVFRYGNQVVVIGDNIYTNVKLDHYDITLFYNLPFVGLASAGMLDVEVGLNVRVIDLKAHVKTSNVDETASVNAPIPMVYGAIEVSPVNLISILFEGRAIAFSGHSYMDLNGELRIKPITVPMAVDFFIGLGYRYERLKLDDLDDVSTDLKITQPYINAGVLF